MRTGPTIARFIRRHLLEPGHHTIDPLAEGLLDSLAMEQLVTFIEDRFAIELADEDLVAENFASLALVVALVERTRLAAGQPS